MSKPEFIARQSSHPRGLFGHVVARVMALETAALNRRVLGILDAQPGERILELGCGHGRSLRRVADRVGCGEAFGVDPSAVMCDVAARHNRAGIRAGRVRVEPGDCEAIPAPNDCFDKAFSVHTLYFWPRLDAGFRELRRVLRPGGELLLAFHSDADAALVEKLPASVYTLPSEDAVATALRHAGFANVALSTLPESQARLARAEA